MACRKLFQAVRRGDDVSRRAELIDAAHPGACCESESVSSHSPGVVADGEFAIRYIFSPIHLEPDGTVHAAAFSDVKDKGLSCERSASQEADETLHARGEAQATAYNAQYPEKAQRTYVGTVQVLTSEVRALLYGSAARAFGVYDTALPTNAEHIDVFQALQASRPEQSRLRKQLRDKFLERGFRPKPLERGSLPSEEEAA